MVADGVMEFFGHFCASLLYGIVKKKELRNRIIPEYFSYFEKLLSKQKSGFVGTDFSFVDLLLFQMIDLIKINYPQKWDKQYPLIYAFHTRIESRPNITAYLKTSPSRASISSFFS